MKKIILLSMVYVCIFAVVSGLGDPAVSSAGNCSNDKVVAKLDIKALKGEDAALETVRQAYRRLANGVDVPLELVLADNGVWTVEGVSGIVPFAGTYEGKEGVLHYLEAMQESICIESLAVRFFVKQGNAIHVHLVEMGVVGSTGKRFEMEIAHVWNLDQDGMIASFREYNDTYAMAAAFDPDADPSLSLAVHRADYGIPTSSYADTLQAGIGFYAALGRADLNYLIGNSDPELVFILAGPPAITPFAGTFYGTDGFVDFLIRVFTRQQFLDIQIKTFTVDGSRLDAEFYEAVYVYATGKIFYNEGLHTVIIGDDGKLRSFRSYNDTHAVAVAYTP